MSRKNIIEFIFNGFSDMRVDYCLLRGYTEIFVDCDFNDVDVYIPAIQYQKFVEHIDNSDVYTFVQRKISPFQCVIYVSGPGSEVTLDVFFDITWLGVSFFSVEDIERNTVKRDGIRALNTAAAAVVIIFKELLQNRRVKNWSNAKILIPVWLSEDRHEALRLMALRLGNRNARVLYQRIMAGEIDRVEASAHWLRLCFLARAFYARPFSTLKRMMLWTMYKIHREISR